jgi:fatty-acyl-CoA synthase
VLGLMQDRPLALPHVFHRAERYFGHKTIASGEARTTVADWALRVRRLASALDRLGITADGRVGTFCWNTIPHLELYVAVPCTGRVLHTLNIRLSAEQLVHVVNDAADEVVFVDRALLPQLWPLADRLPTVRHVVVIDDGSDTEVPADPRLLDLDALLASVSPFEGTFVIEDENTAAAMCYTSGTTGNPKGVVYSHRSTVLHALVSLIADGLALSERDTVMPVVPMFHANAWGLPYGALLAGADLVLPGRNPTAERIVDLLEQHRVSVTAAVPTVWMGVLPLLGGRDLSALRTILCGGSAAPRSLSEGFRERLGVPLLHAWGMTETSPIATLASARSHHTERDGPDARARQGQPVPLVDLRVVDPETGAPCAWDDIATGEVQAAGPWIAAGYHGGDGGSQFTPDGWLRTGDVATVDRYGSVRLVDRTKDLIKSGGEWISSVELENAIMAHPAVAEAAVIAVPHERWVERPLACVVVRDGARLTSRTSSPTWRRWWPAGGCPTPSSSSTPSRGRASASSPRRPSGRSTRTEPRDPPGKRQSTHRIRTAGDLRHPQLRRQPAGQRRVGRAGGRQHPADGPHPAPPQGAQPAARPAGLPRPARRRTQRDRHAGVPHRPRPRDRHRRRRRRAAPAAGEGLRRSRRGVPGAGRRAPWLDRPHRGRARRRLRPVERLTAGAPARHLAEVPEPLLRGLGGRGSRPRGRRATEAPRVLASPTRWRARAHRRVRRGG